MRHRNVGSDRLISKNCLDALTPAEFSSSDSSLGTFQADKCDKFRSAVKTRWAVDLPQLALTATWHTVFQRSLPMTFLMPRICFLSLYGSHPRGELSLHPLLDLPCNLYTGCLDTFFYLSVLGIILMFVWVLFHTRHIFSLLFFGQLVRQKSSFSKSNGECITCCIRIKITQGFKTWHADVRIIMTDTVRDVFTHITVTLSKTVVKRKCYDYISKRILTWSVHPYLGLLKCCYNQSQHLNYLQSYLFYV